MNAHDVVCLTILFVYVFLLIPFTGNLVGKLVEKSKDRMEPRKIPDGEPGGRQFSRIMGKWYNPPFHIGQKVICLSDSDYNREERGAVYTISGFSQTTDKSGWFINVEEVGISKWWGNFIPYEQWPDHFDEGDIKVPTKYL